LRNALSDENETMSSLSLTWLCFETVTRLEQH
jgi:hypothetical protein